MLPIVHHPDYQIPLAKAHRFPMSKYGYLREALIKRGLLQRGRYVAPAPAGKSEIVLAHGFGYVDRVFTGTLGADEARRIGLPCDAVLTRRTRLSCAGTTLAGWLAIEHGIACNSAGGSHHAGPDHGAGFCVFNDVAVASRVLMAQGLPGRILVIDADVHQGDGTALIFANEPRVFTLSIHAEKNFPARKAVSDMDIALPDGTSDAVYLHVLEATIGEAIVASAPSLVFYNAGVDVHGEDRLGRLSLSDAGLRARDALVIGRVRGAGIPLVGVVGGGYANDPEALAERHVVLFEEAARFAS